MNESSELSDWKEEPKWNDDDAKKKVRFDDSVEERTTTLNVGFEIIETSTKYGSDKVQIKGRSYIIKVCGS